ncbi:MAG: ATP-grasp domain-containing protein, partial [Gemmataceae bacterium]
MAKTVIVKRSLPLQGDDHIEKNNKSGSSNISTKRPLELIIVGASVRAVAFSALRAGFHPWCVDLFSDLDLARSCSSIQLTDSYPNGFLTVIKEAPDAPWIYTGGLENYPKLVGQMANYRHLLGNNAKELRKSRHPHCLSNMAKKVGLNPPVWTHQPSSGNWLIKPLRGSGGHGIHRWKSGDRIDPQKEILQEYLEGLSVSAVFCGFNQGSILLGVTRQLVGELFLNAREFHYCGSVGPIQLDGSQTRRLEDLGNHLAEEIGLRGLFGIDGILTNGAFRPLEVNPRYTASIEILEMAMNTSALAIHWGVFHGDTKPSKWGNSSGSCFAKGIYFAPEDINIPNSAMWLNDEVTGKAWAQKHPKWADLPRAGEFITVGRPILTLYSQGNDDISCLEKLKKQ